MEEDRYKLELYLLGFQYRWNERVRIYMENGFDGSNDVVPDYLDDFVAVGIRIDI